MRKIFVIVLFFILIMVSLPDAIAVKSDKDLLNVVIKASLKKESKNADLKYNLKVEKVKTEAFIDIMDKYQEVNALYDKEYEKKRRLVVQSSTVKQAYDNAFVLLKTCIQYINEYDDLKDHALLQLLVGKWVGKAELYSKEKEPNRELAVTRVVNLSFESNQAGQLSKGYAEGSETVKESIYEKEVSEQLQKEDNSQLAKETSEEDYDVYEVIENKKISEVKGSITGHLIPRSMSNFIISIDKADDRVPTKYDKYELNARVKVLMPPFVKRSVTDEAFTLTVSNMKMYYTYLLNSRRSMNELLMDKYQWFFQDQLEIIDILVLGHVSESVYKPLKVYPGSEYVSNSLKDYINTISIYYNKLFLRSNSKKYKLDVYRLYLTELIQLSSIAHLGIVNSKVLKETNLDITKEDNQISRVFDRYYSIGKDYYTQQIRNTAGEEEELFREEYKAFLEEVYQLTKTGIISKNIIDKYNIDADLVKSADNV